MRYLMMAPALALMLVGCGQKQAAETPGAVAAGDPAFAASFQEKLLDAKPGDVIDIPAGKHSFDRSLSLNIDGVTLRGAGMDKTILSFKGQKQGAEGLLVSASDFTIEDIAIEDSKGDALKINEGENIIIRRVRTEWTNGPSTSNGAYGLYPVQTKNILIEDSVAIAASDAGIYVGQSENIIVRRNKALRNVAGIEIENSVNADVYENIATENTGGILVFNMPHLAVSGTNTRLYKNKITANNTANFGAKGTAVASVPAGSGVVINSNDNVEIFDNDIQDNKTANIIVSSYFSTGYTTQYTKSKNFDPYPEGISIRNNRFKGGGNAPDGMDLKALKLALVGLGGSLPDILWDGHANPKATRKTLCSDNANVVNADLPNGSKNARIESKPYLCTLPPIPAVKLTGKVAEALKAS
jgi:parallel beta-helix repeat protein